MLETVVIETKELGDRSYVIHDGTIGVVVDPQRDIERVMEIAEGNGLTISGVFETHIHNDYLTGGLALATELGAQYFVSKADKVSFAREGVNDGDIFRFGDLEIEAIATPGHTLTHMSYVFKMSGERPVLCSGGSLLYGSVGRPDLISAELTPQLARSQFRSAHRLRDRLPADTILAPTHGFGSFCSSGGSAVVPEGNLQDETIRNSVFTIDNEESFATSIISSLDVYPSYYYRMAPRNSAGPERIRLDSFEKLDAVEVKRYMAEGAEVVDIRPRALFAESFISGTLNFEQGDLFTSYFGWIHGFDRKVVLVAADLQVAERAAIAAGRIGIDSIVGYAIFEEIAPSLDTESYQRAKFIDLDVVLEKGYKLLDVRRNLETQSGAIAESLRIPLHEVPDRFEELSSSNKWAIHCAGGFRASVAGSLLAAKDYEVVVIDDDLSAAAGEGIVKLEA